MTILILGVALFTLLHLVPFYAPTARASVIEKVGRGPYRGIFAVVALISVLLIVTGWRASEPGFVYAPPIWGVHATSLLVLFGFILFFSSRAPTNIKRWVRHPQLTGLFLWALGHLIANGEDRSLVLFGGFAVWSVLAIVGANRRDGEWQKPEKQSIIKDVITIVIGLVLYSAFVMIHEWLIGVSPMPMG